MRGPDQAGRFLAGLAACGWFDALPPGSAESLRRAVDEALQERSEPWVGLVAVAADSGYLLDDHPFTALLRQFAEASRGAFVPEDVRETGSAGGTRLAFRVRGRDYGVDLPAEADDVPRAFYDAINQAMGESGSPLRFLELHDLGWGPIPGFALAEPAAFVRAVAGKLVPGEEPSGEVTAEEMERLRASIEVALLGRETFYWTAGGVAVGEAAVPGGYEEETTDDRVEGEGILTILKYEEAGTMMFLCGPPKDEPLPLPKEFHLEQERDQGGRLVRSGRAKLAGTPMAWRQDKLREAPVHVGFCVKVSLAGAFAEAVETFRLLERTPETEALFQSCLAPKEPRKKGRKR